MSFMNRISKITLCVLVVIGFVINTHAQDTRPSQPLANQLLVNPAMMGLTNDFRVIVNYRNQWASIDKGYSSYSASLIHPLFLNAKGDTSGKEAGRSRLDFGLNVIDDKSGGFNRISATLSIGYGLKLNAANSLHAALTIGYINYQINALDQTFDEQYINGTFNVSNPTGESLRLQKGAPDVGLGFMWRYAPENNKLQVFAGLAGYHVNQPNMSLISGRGTLPARFNFQAGAKVIGAKMDFTPVVIYNLQGPFKQFIGGLLFAYKFDTKGKLVIGTWFKERDAITPQIGYEHKIFFLNYSYDFGISRLARTTRGLMTHEVSLGFKIMDVGGKKGVKTLNFL